MRQLSIKLVLNNLMVRRRIAASMQISGDLNYLVRLILLPFGFELARAKQSRLSAQIARPDQEHVGGGGSRLWNRTSDRMIIIRSPAGLARLARACQVGGTCSALVHPGSAWAQPGAEPDMTRLRCAAAPSEVAFKFYLRQ